MTHHPYHDAMQYVKDKMCMVSIKKRAVGAKTRSGKLRMSSN